MVLAPTLLAMPKWPRVLIEDTAAWTAVMTAAASRELNMLNVEGDSACQDCLWLYGRKRPYWATGLPGSLGPWVQRGRGDGGLPSLERGRSAQLGVHRGELRGRAPLHVDVQGLGLANVPGIQTREPPS